jgi:hypothetical protein
MNTLVKLLADTDYDVQQLVGDKVKEIRYKEAHKKVFSGEVLDELDDLQQFYEQNKAFDRGHGGMLCSFPIYLRHIDFYQGEGTTEDYFPFFEYNGSLDTGNRWGEPRRRLINGHYEDYDVFKDYYKIREEINRFLFE